MPIFRAKIANVCLRDDGTAEMRFRTPDNSSVSVTMSEPALHVLAQQIAAAMLPPAGGGEQEPTDG